MRVWYGRAVNKTRPLPATWYFPDGKKSILLPTGDAHANPLSYFTNLINSVNAANGHITLYLTPWGSLAVNDAQLNAWIAQGHEFGIHPDASPQPTNSTLLNQAILTNLSWWQSRFTSQPSRTVRFHQVTWVGWDDAAEIAVARGLSLDTNFYHWGPWLKKPDNTWPHGYITGSGQSMKMVTIDGTILPYYQQLTQLVDEQFFSIIGGSNSSSGWESLTPQQATNVAASLIDASLAGDYSAIMTQFHVDYSSWGEVEPWIGGTINYANSKGVPVWTSGKWLNFLETRDATRYDNIVWNNSSGTLAFNMVGSTAPGFSLSVMLPVNYGGRGLQSVLVDGTSANFYFQTINGENIAFVNVSPGNHTFSVNYSGLQLTVTPSNPPTSTPTSTLPPSATPTFGPSPTSLPTPYPVLDNFNRADGALGANWSGSTSKYAIAGNALDVIEDADIYWKANSFGSDQSVFVRIANYVSTATEIDLLLKAQSSDNWSSGVLQLSYSPASHTLSVWSYTPSQGWVKYGADIPATLGNYDTFGARSRSDGTVEVYVNGSLIATRNASSWPFSSGGGYIGIWTINAQGTLLDDFGGGGNVIPVTPTNGPSPTPTSSPTNGPSLTPTNSPTPSNTPVLGGVLDPFNRANGGIGGNWNGSTSSYAINNNQLDVNGSGDIYWSANSFGSDQQVSVILTNIDTQAVEIDLILKSQSNNDWGSGLIEVYYDAAGHFVQVWTYSSTQGWQQHGANIPVTFVNGNKFGARALPNGTVEVYQNGALLGTRDVSTWGFNASGGYIGLWMVNASNMILDDFDGGNYVVVTPTFTPSPTLTPTNGPSATPTTTPSPTNTLVPTNTPTNTPVPTNTPTSTPVIAACFADQVTANFAAGTVGSGAFLSSTFGGEVILAPTFNEDFNGPALPAGWNTVSWQAGTNIAIVNGQLSVTNGAAGMAQTYAPGRSLVFAATFQNAPWQHVGLEESLSFNDSWAIFSTGNGTNGLMARTSDGNNTILGASYLGAAHQYRIEWTVSSVVFSVDGVVVATHNVGLANPLRPIVSSNSGASGLVVDWMQLTPYATNGTFTSRVYDAGAVMDWGSATWNSQLPVGSALTISVRGGNTPTPDGTWSAFTPLAGSGSVVGISTRFVQYQAVLSGSGSYTPVLADIGFACTTPVVVNGAPSVAANQATVAVNEGVAAANTGTFSDPDNDPVALSASVGTVTATGANTWSWSYPTTDGPANTQTVTITANDGRGGITQTTFGLTVNNVGPTADFGTTTFTVGAGQSVGLLFSNQADPSPADTTAGFVYSYDCTNDGTYELADSTSATFNCFYGAAGTYIINGRIADKDGGANLYQIAIQVMPVAATNTPVPTNTPTNTPVPPTNTPTSTPVVAACMIDDTLVDFGLGTTGANTSIIPVGNGAVSLKSNVDENFAGTALPAGWQSALWSPTGTVVVGGSQVTAQDAIVFGNAAALQGYSMEFVATFGNGPWQHVGLVKDISFNSPWAIFSTWNTTGTLYTRTSDGTNTAIPGNWIGTPHLYRIDWVGTNMIFSIDGTIVSIQTNSMLDQLHPTMSDAGSDGISLAVDWMRLTPFATNGTFTSRVFDAGQTMNWGQVTWTSTVVASTTLQVSVRTGNTPAPDGTWTAFTPLAGSGINVGMNGRYIQYQVAMTTSDVVQTPRLESIAFQCVPGAPPQALVAPQQVTVPTAEPTSTDVPVVVEASPTAVEEVPTNTPEPTMAPTNTLEPTLAPTNTPEPTLAPSNTPEPPPPTVEVVVEAPQDPAPTADPGAQPSP
ncbi:MAG: hypothetical protein R3E39_22010 [Anaerolineae bacterium]